MTGTRTADGRAGERDRELALRVVEAAVARGVRCATAESCTGGLIGGLITAIPGSSEAYAGSVVAYANEVKAGLLGVRRDTLERWGAVSEAVAREMADGASRALGADVAVSVTGIAGPGGGTPDKPVGLVWFGLATADETIASRKLLDGDRDEVRSAAVRHALTMILDALET